MAITLVGTPTIANNGAGATSTLSVNVPAGVVDGDVMIGLVANSNTAVTNVRNLPAGWTAIDDSGSGSGSTPGMRTFFRVASSEPASYNFTIGTTDRMFGIIIAYRGVDTVTLPDGHNITNLGATSTVNLQVSSVTTTKAGDQLVGFYAVRTNTTITQPTGTTEQGEQANSVWDIEVSDETLGAAGATGTRTATAAAGGTYVGALVALAPASATAASSGVGFIPVS